MKFIAENFKYILLAIVIIIGIVGIKGIDEYFQNRAEVKEYKETIKELNAKIEVYEKEIVLRLDTINSLQVENSVLQDSIQVINIKLKEKTDEKNKVVYVVQSMSISDQQRYFTDRYK